MKNLKPITRVLGILALLVIVLSLTVSTSEAQVTGPAGKGVRPLTQGPIPVVNSPEGTLEVPGGPGFVILNAFDFTPYSQNSGFFINYGLLQNTGTGYAYYTAPVHLPQGATINQMVAYYYDDDTNVGKDISLWMMRCYVMDGACGTIMASIESPPNPTSGSIYTAMTTSIYHQVIDNASYSYAIQIGWSNSNYVALSAVRIDYGYSSSLPAIMR